MAMLRTANAKIVKHSLEADDWDNIRKAGLTGSAKMARQAGADPIPSNYSPEKFLLTHCTIIASVDVEAEPLNDRGWPFYITADTEKYVNSNEDAWERDLLLATYNTFRGAENYVEHIQIPELSKGKIVDAVARDLGDTVYVDILVATDLKHKDLVADIKSGKITTLSMGCFLPDTQVTLADGTRLPIQDIRPGEMVLTHKGRVREVQNLQVRIGSHNIQEIDVVGIPTTIRATDVHPFFVLRESIVCECGCGELFPSYAQHVSGNKHTYRRMSRRFLRGHDKRIFNPTAKYTEKETLERKARLAAIKAPKIVEVSAADLKPGDFLCFPKVSANTGEVSTNRARLLGYFLAEGSYLKSKGTRVGVEFSFSHEELNTYASEVVEMLLLEFPGCKARAYDRENRGSSRVHASGKEMSDWFYAHAGEYSHRKVVSENVMGWTVENQLNVLGSWINGDGWAIGPTCGVTTSHNLICQLHAMAARCGIYSRIEACDGLNACDIKRVVNGDVRHPETGKLPSFTLVFGQTQAQKLEKYTDKTVQSAWDVQNLRVLDEYVLYPIKDVRAKFYQGPVYDIEVEEDHSYIADGVAVHNCTVDYTICSKCGNVAEDDTQMCDHIKYMKGNHFFDKKGKRRKIAELCGHKEDDDSVTFIEASWVGNPAFKGAVMRQILEATDVSAETIKAAFDTENVVDADAMLRAASDLKEVKAAFSKVENFTQRQGGFNFDDEGGDEGGDEGEDGAAPAEDTPAVEPKPIDDITDDMKNLIRDRVKQELRDELRGVERDKQDQGVEDTNDTLIESAFRNTFAFSAFKNRYAGYGNNLMLYRLYEGLVSIKTAGWKGLSDKGYTGREILALSQFIDAERGRETLSQRAIEAVAKVGGTSAYDSPLDYLNAVGKAAGIQKVPMDVARNLIYKGNLYSYGVDE